MYEGHCTVAEDNMNVPYLRNIIPALGDPIYAYNIIYNLPGDGIPLTLHPADYHRIHIEAPGV